MDNVEVMNKAYTKHKKDDIFDIARASSS